MSWRRIALFTALIFLSIAGTSYLFRDYVPQGVGITNAWAFGVAALELALVLVAFAVLGYKQTNRTWLHAGIVALFGIAAVLFVNIYGLGYQVPQGGYLSFVTMALSDLALFAIVFVLGVFLGIRFRSRGVSVA